MRTRSYTAYTGITNQSCTFIFKVQNLIIKQNSKRTYLYRFLPHYDSYRYYSSNCWHTVMHKAYKIPNNYSTQNNSIFQYFVNRNKVFWILKKHGFFKNILYCILNTFKKYLILKKLKILFNILIHHLRGYSVKITKFILLFRYYLNFYYFIKQLKFAPIKLIYIMAILLINCW